MWWSTNSSTTKANNDNNNTTSPITECPVKHKNANISECPVKSKINPLNNIPADLNNSSDPKSTLNTERQISSIPRDKNENWVYPSEQQFYNALKRKNMETDEEHVSMIVSIHNHLNEQCWDEIKRWEKTQGNENPKLVKFVGRPSEPSPKARILNFFGISPLPFDRHDWVVDRNGREVRYVIDYYDAQTKPGEAAMSIDARPAFDSFSSVYERFNMWLTGK